MKSITTIFLFALPALCMNNPSLTSTATTTSLLSAEAPAIIYSTVASPVGGHYTHVPSNFYVIDHNRTRLNGTGHEPHPIFTGTKHEVNGTEEIVVNPSLIPDKNGAGLKGGEVSMGLMGVVGFVIGLGM